MFRPVIFVLSFLCSSLALAHGDALQVLTTRLADKAAALRQAGTVPVPDKVLALQKELGFEELDIVVLKHSQMGAGATVENVLILDSRVLSQPRPVLAFILAHEYAHWKARHLQLRLQEAVRVATEDGEDPVEALEELGLALLDESFLHEHEFEADRYARFVLVAHRLWDERAVRNFLAAWVNDGATHSHPSLDDRLAAMQMRPLSFRGDWN